MKLIAKKRNKNKYELQQVAIEILYRLNSKLNEKNKIF